MFFPLIPSFKQKISQHGFRKRPLHSMRVRSFVNSLNFVSRLEIACTTVLSRIGMRSFSSLTSSIVITTHYNESYSCYTRILAIQLLMIQQQKKLPVLSLCSAVREIWPLKVLITLITPLFLGSGPETIRSNRFFSVQLPLYLPFRKPSGYFNDYSNMVSTRQRVYINN